MRPARIELLLSECLAMLSLNAAAAELCRTLVREAELWRVTAERAPCGAALIDAGIGAPGGLEAGRRVAEICMGGRGTVDLVPAHPSLAAPVAVQVRTDAPVQACLHAQYAGWPVSHGKYFAMGSGPMRAKRGKEKLLVDLAVNDDADVAVGILESARLPDDDVCADIARQCSVAPGNLTLIVAPTSSIVGTLQVVARSAETALHKLVELGFDVGRIVSAMGLAPLPPVAGNDLDGIARTNDAVLYGAHVTLWVRGDEVSIQQLGPRVPSSASPDAGRLFREIFEACGRDFYKIDPLLFSPASIEFVCVDTGTSYQFGRISTDLLTRSFERRLSREAPP